jgi:hypothetical protein
MLWKGVAATMEERIVYQAKTFGQAASNWKFPSDLAETRASNGHPDMTTESQVACYK